MMRIAIAGGGGLGYLLATRIAQADTAYNVVVLSRTAREEFLSFDIQVQPVNYDDHEGLAYAMQGTDLVICTLSGQEQLNLIHAARASRVRLFVPSEFEGALSHRNDPTGSINPWSSSTLATLEQMRGMRYTVFSCGLFMERFHPRGLTHFNIGYRAGVPGPGEFLVNTELATAEYAAKDSRGKTVRVCLTSVYDLAKYVVAAIEIGPGNWPREFTLRGDRLTLQDVVRTCSNVANSPIAQTILPYNDLEAYINYYTQIGDARRVTIYTQLLATADGRYDFTQASLNEVLERNRRDVQAMSFPQWLSRVWHSS